jgi:hypothetical protein
LFILDSLMISGIRWALQMTLDAAEAEMNDDSALTHQLLEAEMRREMGEISDEEFRATETDLLARIREIRERREGAGPLTLGAAPIERQPGSRFAVEAELSGEFHAPAPGAPARFATVRTSRASRASRTPQRSPRPRTSRPKKA